MKLWRYVLNSFRITWHALFLQHWPIYRINDKPQYACACGKWWRR